MIRTGLYASVLLVAVMAAFSVYGFFHIPPEAELPRQWTFEGEVRTSPRNVYLLLMPLMALGISVLFVLIPFIDPQKDNIRRSAGLYSTSWLGTLTVLATVHGTVVFTAASGAKPELLPEAPFYGLCLLLVLIGNFVPKSRPNWFMGVRTPWSLSSEHAWSMSNRVAGWLCVLAGLAAAATAILRDTKAGYTVLIVGIFAMALISVVVSYLAWRADRGTQ